MNRFDARARARTPRKNVSLSRERARSFKIFSGTYTLDMISRRRRWRNWEKKYRWKGGKNFSIPPKINNKRKWQTKIMLKKTERFNLILNIIY